MQPPATKKPRLELFDIPAELGSSRSAEEIEQVFRDAVKSHPFYDNVHCIADVYRNGVLRDGEGQVLGVLVKQGLPEYARKMAADVLRPAAVRTSLRASIFGGEAPLSGIAGYFDYRGSPVEFKCRKTAFTYEHERTWPNVFPMIDYVSAIYKETMPTNWEVQNAAIPDVVRIHGSPFSTLTINSRFRTAHHTDAGDFDEGYGCLACLEGPFRGLALTFDDFRVNFVMQPGDVLIFNTHHFHSNTEPEVINDSDWQRLTCVFYYRAALGEPASYAEYQRRLSNAMEKCDGTAPLFDTVRVKNNGENYNRPAPVRAVSLSPFALTSVLQSLRHCAAAGACLHKYFLHRGSAAERLLFGECMLQSNGLPVRPEDDLQCIHASSSLFKAPAMGGFKECDVTVGAASHNQRFLDTEHLSQLVSSELLNIWQTARSVWLSLVKEEWDKMLKHNPDRVNFTWNNRSEMNSAFFDLCEVGKQVLLGMLNAESVSPREEQAFWALFAAHLSTACTATLSMPAEAMSLRKLNVKIKDFTFGGTRYFKDMPEGEQKRRLARKQRIEEARRGLRESSTGGSRRGKEWLANDSFDYQTEDCAVVYDGEDRVTPDENAQRVTNGRGDAKLLQPAEEMELSLSGAIRVEVVLPRPSSMSVETSVGNAERDPHTKSEYARLTENVAAKDILAAAAVAGGALPPNAEESIDGTGCSVLVQYSYATENPPEGPSPDFLVLQHVLCTITDDVAAAAYVQAAASRTRGAVLVEETDLHDRQFFRLKPEVRDAYLAMAPTCFRALHMARYGAVATHLRTKAQLEEILPGCCARYKLVGSPLNTALMIVPGTAKQ